MSTAIMALAAMTIATMTIAAPARATDGTPVSKEDMSALVKGKTVKVADAETLIVRSR